MDILIPIAKASKKIKSSPHKSLIKLNKKITVLEYQLNVIDQLFDNVNTYLFVDEFSHDIVNLVGNYIHKLGISHTINIIESGEQSLSSCLKMGFDIIKQRECVVIMGDILFNRSAVRAMLNRKTSSFLTDNKFTFARNEIGLWHEDGVIQQFSYSMPLKWCQMCYLNEDFVKMFCKKYQDKLMPHEIFNKVLDTIPGKVVQSKKAKVLEIDKPKDIRMAKQLFL